MDINERIKEKIKRLEKIISDSEKRNSIKLDLIDHLEMKVIKLETINNALKVRLDHIDCIVGDSL